MGETRPGDNSSIPHSDPPKNGAHCWLFKAVWLVLAASSHLLGVLRARALAVTVMSQECSEPQFSGIQKTFRLTWIKHQSAVRSSSQVPLCPWCSSETWSLDRPSLVQDACEFHDGSCKAPLWTLWVRFGTGCTRDFWGSPTLPLRAGK